MKQLTFTLAFLICSYFSLTILAYTENREEEQIFEHQYSINHSSNFDQVYGQQNHAFM